MRRFLVLLLLVSAGTACKRGASTERVPDAAIDALFAEWSTPDSAGCGVGVTRNGTMVFERGYGMADLERKVPITTATIFDPASIAKPFTALSIMLLAEQGKLSLDDEVWKYLPEWVNRQDRVTIRHLLAHTAGLRDAFLLIELAPPAAAGVDINEHILRTLAGQRGLNFAPSSEFSYNNGGYNVLGSIVARVQRTILPRLRRRARPAPPRHEAVLVSRRSGHDLATACPRISPRRPGISSRA